MCSISRDCFPMIAMEHGSVLTKSNCVSLKRATKTKPKKRDHREINQQNQRYIRSDWLQIIYGVDTTQQHNHYFRVRIIWFPDLMMNE